jgi:hypothetical protein
VLLTVSGSNNLRRKGGNASSMAGAAASGSNPVDSIGKLIYTI